MERAEAEAIYQQRLEAVVAVLMELSAQNALLGRQVAELSERLAKQDKRIAELERRLNRNSHNSSTPPSQDSPGAPPRPRRAASSLRAGGQPGAFGPRLQAAVATLSVRNRVPRRDLTELTRELFGAELSAGAVEAILQRAAAALEEPYEDLLCHIRAAPAVNLDKDRLEPTRR
jgi:Family of unknown function (DUF6444)/Transposase IS66 family